MRASGRLAAASNHGHLKELRIIALFPMPLSEIKSTTRKSRTKKYIVQYGPENLEHLERSCTTRARHTLESCNNLVQLLEEQKEEFFGVVSWLVYLRKKCQKLQLFQR